MDEKIVKRHKISRRGGFSDRNGINPENKEIQLTSFDERTRIQLINMISELYFSMYSSYSHHEKEQKFLGFVVGD